MRKFQYKVIWFMVILILPIVIGLLLPVTPKASKYLIFGHLLKDSLMKNVESRRVIFVGGSNLSFGLNSQMIKDSLNMNPINTGIHAAIGLVYMMSNSLEYIKEGDIVVLVPEYQQFYGDLAYGSEGEELIRTFFDVNISKLSLLKIKQIRMVIHALPKYALSKFKISEYLGTGERDIYCFNSFNKYGDAYKHWGMKKEVFKTNKDLGNNFNQEIFDEIKEYQKEIERRKAVLLISYPGYQDSSYLNSKDNIKEIENQLIMKGLNTIGSPERYVIPDSLVFNTPYHLSKSGVDYRTSLLISDIRNALKKSNGGCIHYN